MLNVSFLSFFVKFPPVLCCGFYERHLLWICNAGIGLDILGAISAIHAQPLLLSVFVQTAESFRGASLPLSDFAALPTVCLLAATHTL